MSQLVATWHSSQQEPQILINVSRRTKPRRWRISIWVQRGTDQISETIVAESPAHLHELLETTLETVRDLQAELPGFTQAGFDIHQLKRKRG